MHRIIHVYKRNSWILGEWNIEMYISMILFSGMVFLEDSIVKTSQTEVWSTVVKTNRTKMGEAIVSVKVLVQSPRKMNSMNYALSIKIIK